MIGLGWDFRPLLPCDRLEVSGERITFDRVVWVAHSLGTVISYNVLSDLFARATEVEQSGDAEQRAGVQRFRSSLRRFVTLGSPLDKISFLFGEKTLRPWPKDRPRRHLLHGGETVAPGQSRVDDEWWINFYHVLDPVSGPLGDELICGRDPPANFHVQPPLTSWLASFFLPGWAHSAYWRDLKTLRYILGRTYGKEYLYNQEYRPWPEAVKDALAFVGTMFWFLLILIGGPLLVLELAVALRITSHNAVFEAMRSWLGL